jgi:hypothetical protein
MASGDMVSRRRSELERFLKGFMLSWNYYASHPERVNAWYVKESRLDVSHAALELSASVEPNRAARSLSDIRLDFTEEDRANLRSVARFLHERGTIGQAIDPDRFIDLGALRAVSMTDVARLVPNVRARE